MEILLISNSTNIGEPFLSYCSPEISSLIRDLKGQVVFIPYAGVTLSWDDYTERVKEALAKINKNISGIHTAEDPIEAVENAAAIIVGGGNSWQLLDRLQKNKLMEPIRERVRKGIPYIGWSAGSNMACPTLMTTNDMPIVEPESFRTLGLIPFQVNPHYTEATLPNHGGESREQRINEFIEVNRQVKVLGLPEGMMIRYSKGEYRIIGTKGIKLFKHGMEPEWIGNDGKLNEFLRG